MTRTAPLAALALLTVLSPAAVGDERPRRPARCADPAGDVRLTDTGPVVDAPSIDLRSADIARGRRTLTVVIRTAGAPDEGMWKATFSLGGKSRYFVVAARGVAGSPLDEDTRPGFRAGPVGGPAQGAVGRYDPVKREVRVTAPMTAFGRKGVPDGAPAGVRAEARRKVVTTGSTDVSLVDYLTCERGA